MKVKNEPPAYTLSHTPKIAHPLNWIEECQIRHSFILMPYPNGHAWIVFPPPSKSPDRPPACHRPYCPSVFYCFCGSSRWRGWRSVQPWSEVEREGCTKSGGGPLQQVHRQRQCKSGHSHGQKRLRKIFWMKNVLQTQETTKMTF